MEGLGSVLWLLIIGLFFYFMMKRGGCCGGHSHGSKDHKEDGSDTGDKEEPEHKQQKGCH